jgi:cell division protein ZapE
MSQHTFSPPADDFTSPKAWYQAMCSKPGFIYDAAQAAAIADLDTLWHELITFKAKRNEFLGRSLFSPEVPQGLYFWGGVGRGKSFLMDVFYDCVPYKRKHRIHFHKFMADVHQKMKELEASQDPLLAVADSIAKSTRLLCFDEFHVNDIADAMILGRLLEAMFNRGVVMMITSNYAPDKLYPNGLQRQKFLPAIELLKHKLKVVQIDSGNDYRLRENANSPLWMLASDPSTHGRMESIFHRLSPNGVQNPQEIQIQGRSVSVKKLSDKTVWFDFREICGGPRSQADYLEISSQFSTVFVSDIPLFTANEAAEMQRFIWLIDILYDNRCKLVASAAASPQAICRIEPQPAEFARTISRLTEMQSQSFLELPHQVEFTSMSPHTT